MKAGDIILIKSESFIAKTISLFIGSRYTHVLLAVDHENVIEADRFIDSRVIKFEEKANLKYKIMEPIVPLDKVQIKLLQENAYKLVGLPYDWVGISILFVQLVFKANAGSIVGSTNSFWCSELVDFIYTQLNVDLVPQVQSSFVSPADIERSPALVEVKGGYRTN